MCLSIHQVLSFIFNQWKIVFFHLDDLKLLCLVATKNLEDEVTTSKSDEQLILDNQRDSNYTKEISISDKSCKWIWGWWILNDQIKIIVKTFKIMY